MNKVYLVLLIPRSQARVLAGNIIHRKNRVMALRPGDRNPLVHRTVWLSSNPTGLKRYIRCNHILSKISHKHLQTVGSLITAAGIQLLRYMSVGPARNNEGLAHCT